MVLARCILLATAPSLFWLWMYYRRDRWEPEPKLLVLKLFAYGALVAAPVWWVQSVLPGPSSRFYDNFVRVALVEELFKLAPVVFFAVRRREFDEPMDGIIYAVAAALGFAAVENAIYAFLLGDHLLLCRVFTSTLAHVGFSGLIGFSLGAAWFRPRGHRRAFVRVFLAVVAMHGTYDLLLQVSASPRAPDWLGRVTIIVLVPTLLLLLRAAIALAHRASPFAHQIETPAPKGDSQPVAQPVE